MSKIPEQKQGFQRILRAWKFSLHGFLHAIKKEEAFRQEVIGSFVLIPILFFLPISLVVKLVVIGSHCFVLVTELLNSAIEAVVDLSSPDYHDLAKQAKDMGSLAVLIAIKFLVISWLVAIYLVLTE
jgi:diacylglycerol kinase (ATP)